MTTAPRQELGAALRKKLQAARKTWPEVELSEAEFVAHARGLGADGGGVHVSDLYLACACAKGEPKAIAAFEKRYFPEVADTLARLDDSGTLIDEVKQLLREKLFVAPPGKRPKIADYSGRGPLAGWTCAAALKTALSLKRRHRKEVSLEDTPIFEMPSDDPEMDFIKATHQNDFRVALSQAFAELSPRERTVMRLHLIDELNIDAIGTMYQAHRSTVARWIQKTRQAIFDRTREILVHRLGLRQSELNNLMRLLRSQLDVSIARYLKSNG